MKMVMSSDIKVECQGKERYDSRTDVMKKIFKLQYDSFGGVSDLRPYKCKHCKGWHLTSTIK